jgi:tRNA-2-methylthio-N6-dimethylallyladenosine synthase
MAEREGPAMMRRFPHIDLMCGPGELDKLPMLLDNVCKGEAIELADRIALQGDNARRSATLHAAEDNLELLDLSRAFDPDGADIPNSAYVRITRGCNKFCTYCVVPYTRGPEVHRPPHSIVEECKRLADAGVIEVTLLGQTVNHYLYTHGAAVTNGVEAPQIGPGLSAFARRYPGSPNRESVNGARSGTPGSESRATTTFADLLHRIHEEVPAIQRLRFVTSFPLHFGDDILHAMRDCPRICRYLHVPAQSGSNRILKLMNRGYTREQYLDFIDRVRAILPDAEIAGDFIVGFPTETEEDFEQTKDLLRRVRFKNNFIFKYSPRPGTTAIKRFEDDVPPEIKRRRNNELLALQTEISAEVHAAYIGRTVDVFIERVTNRSKPGQSEDRRSRSSAAPGHAPPGHAPPGHAPPGRATLTISAAATATASESGRAATVEPGPSQPLSYRHGSEAGRHAQLSGRTAGDLIAVFDAPPGANLLDMPGRIHRMRIVASAPLLLIGEPA